DRRRRRLAGDPRLRNGPSQGAGELRPRFDTLPGLRLRHGNRAHRDAEVRHPGPPDLLRIRPPVAASLRLPAAGDAQPGAGAPGMKFTLSWLRDHLETTAPL